MGQVVIEDVTEDVTVDDGKLAPSMSERWLTSTQQGSLSYVLALALYNEEGDVMQWVGVQIGPGDWSPGAANVQIGQRNWRLALSGPSFAVWDAVM